MLPMTTFPCRPLGPAMRLLLCVSLLFMSACSPFNETRFENTLGRNIDLVDFSEAIADDLLEQALPPLVPRQPGLPILATTFVDENDLRNTSQLGRILQQQIASRFVQQGYAVKEIRLRKELLVEEQSGETLLTRQLSLLKQKQSAQAVLVGTISQAQRILYLSARLVNPTDLTIIAAKNYRLYMDKHVLAMLNLRVIDSDDVIGEPPEPLMNSLLYF